MHFLSSLQRRIEVRCQTNVQFFSSRRFFFRCSMTTTRPLWNETFKSPLLTVHSSVNTSSSSSDVWLRKFLLACLLFTLSIFTVCGNLLVLYAIRTEKRLRTVSNLFILSLALADFIVGLVVMPFSAANLLAGRWPFSYLICQMWLSVDYVARSDGTRSKHFFVDRREGRVELFTSLG